MKKYFLALLAPLLLVLSNGVFAVGLGDITVQSKLNEPFKARIALIQTRDLTENQINVALASQAEFDKHRLVRSALYMDLDFRVDMLNAAGPSILVSSSAPIKEPSLDFLIELSWPSGTLVRGYTVLMEKP